jgi:hypothetical protein
VVRRLARCTPLCVVFLLAACVAGGNVGKPVPSAFYPAPETPERLVGMRRVSATALRIWNTAMWPP